MFLFFLPVLLYVIPTLGVRYLSYKMFWGHGIRTLNATQVNAEISAFLGTQRVQQEYTYDHHTAFARIAHATYLTVETRPPCP